MNRHFRVPPEHQVFWDDINAAARPFIPALLFVVIIIVLSIIAFW